MEPNSNHKTAGLPNIRITGPEKPILLDHDGIVTSVLCALAYATSHNPDWVVEQLSDLDAIAQVEARGMSVADRSSDDVIRHLYDVIGHPVVEINDGEALLYADRLRKAADSVASESADATRRALRLQEAQALVSEAAARNTGHREDTGTYSVTPLGEALGIQPSDPGPATHGQDFDND